MASHSSTARSISEVSRESLLVELQGSVQTVFPLRACIAPTANSETQDYGTVGSDGPLEGANKVFQVTLRDLGADQGGLHRINVYFYDGWADENARLRVGDEVAVSGPAAILVRPDPSACSGDHPFCLALHTSGGAEETDDDPIVALGAVGADLVGKPGIDCGGGGGKVTCKIVRQAEWQARAGSAAVGGSERVGRGATGRGGGRGQGRGRGRGTSRDEDGGENQSRPGVNQGKTSYMYTNLASLQVADQRANVYGVVCSFNHPHQSKGRDMTTSLALLDESRPDSDNAVPCNFFHPTKDKLPAPLMVGDIVRIHRAKIQQYRERPQLLGIHGAAWLIIRRKQAAREAFQRGPPTCGAGAAVGGGRGGGNGDDYEDLESDEDSPPSGADAGGGQADSVLPAREWEVKASSPNFTLAQVDHDRCTALYAWLVSKAPHLWLKPSSEPKIWVQDIFRRPQGGPAIVVTEVELVCCLLSKHERNGGGAGSLANVYVSDGTGYSDSPPGSNWDGRRDSALTKGMRFALGKPKWSPGNQRPPPFPAHLKIEVLENVKEWEALALTPGMWIRLRRLAITKNRATGNMSAKMIDKPASVNPLHPMMAEVQAVAAKYAAHCARAANSSSSSGSDTSSANPPTRPPDNARVQQASRADASVPDPRQAGPTSPPTQDWQPLPSERDPSSASCAARQGAPDATRQPIRQSGVATSSGANVSVNDGIVGGSDLPGHSGAGMENEARRPAKRARPISGAAGTRTPSQGTLKNLGVVRCTPAPSEFDSRVRIVAHFPAEVSDFVRQGPGLEEDLCFLFTLRLEDDYGVVDAVATGLDASCLLPGKPTPAQFRSSADVRQTAERLLARLESDRRSWLGLRLRSYVMPLKGARRGGGSGRADFCKHFSVVAPSSLEEGCGA